MKKISNTETGSPVPGNIPQRLSEPPDPREAQNRAEGGRRQEEVGKDSGVGSKILAVGNGGLSWEECGGGLVQMGKLRQGVP